MNLFRFPVRSILREARVSLKLSLPLIASEFVYGLGSFTSTAMVAHLGQHALAANAIGWSVSVMVFVFFIGILSSTGVLVAQSFGAQDANGVHNALNQGILMGIFCTIPMALIMYITPEVLVLTGQDPHVMHLLRSYLHAWAWCMLPLNIMIVVEQFLIGVGKTRLVMAMSVIAVPLQILFFYLLVFGKYGFPNCGLSGVAYAMALAFLILALIVGSYLKFSPQFKKYRVFENLFHINKTYFWEIIRIGVPLGAMFWIELALFSVAVFMMSKLGTTVLAAHQIAYQYFMLALTVIFGLSQGAPARIGHEVGRNDRVALKLAAYVNMGLGFVIMLVPSVIFLLFPRFIMGLDINVNAPQNRQLVHFATLFLAFVAVLQLSDSIRLITASILRGLKDTKVPMFVSLICFWLVGLPIAYLLAFPLHLGGIGVWIGILIGLVLCGIILVTRFVFLINRVNLENMLTKD